LRSASDGSVLSNAPTPAGLPTDGRRRGDRHWRRGDGRRSFCQRGRPPGGGIRRRGRPPTGASSTVASNTPTSTGLPADGDGRSASATGRRLRGLLPKGAVRRPGASADRGVRRVGLLHRHLHHRRHHLTLPLLCLTSVPPLITLAAPHLGLLWHCDHLASPLLHPPPPQPLLQVSCVDQPSTLN